jgi:hypothetical protein
MATCNTIGLIICGCLRPTQTTCERHYLGERKPAGFGQYSVIGGAIEITAVVQHQTKRWLYALQKSALHSTDTSRFTAPRLNTRTCLEKHFSAQGRGLRRFDPRPRAETLVRCHEEALSVLRASGVKITLFAVRSVRREPVAFSAQLFLAEQVIRLSPLLWAER